MNWKGLTPTEFCELDRNAIALVQQQGTHEPFEKEYFHKNGARVPVLVGKAHLGGADELGIEFIVDLSARKQAEHEREQLVCELRTQQRQLEESRMQLYEKVQELERFQDLVVGRELKLIDLEKEVQRLRGELEAIKSRRT